jgi:hypothetical protein
MSYRSMTSIESEEPTLPPNSRKRRWDINGSTPIEAPPKAPTKQNVERLLKDLYDLRTAKEVENKYTEFRVRLYPLSLILLSSCLIDCDRCHREGQT